MKASYCEVLLLWLQLFITRSNCYFQLEILESDTDVPYFRYPCNRQFTVPFESGLVNIVRPDNNTYQSREPQECHCLVYPGNGTWPVSDNENPGNDTWPVGDNEIIELEYGADNNFITITTYTWDGPLHVFDAVPFILNTTSSGRSDIYYLSERTGSYIYGSLDGGSGIAYYRFNPTFPCDISCSPHEFYRSGYRFPTTTSMPESSGGVVNNAIIGIVITAALSLIIG